MRWVSHIAIAGSICAVFNPIALPAAVLGSTAPDWFEMVVNSFRKHKRVKHRAITHYLIAWAVGICFGHFISDWQGYVFWFSTGGAIHWVCDALTISGAPLGWWSDRRMTLFGGKVYTGSPAEYVIVALVVVVCAFFAWSKHAHGGFMPFFIDWGDLYEKGVIDGVEWRANRFNIV